MGQISTILKAVLKNLFNVFAPKAKEVIEDISPDDIALEIDEPREILWRKSPNYRAKKDKKNTAIILHHTGSFNFNGELSWMQNPESKVSAHYLIGMDGKIAQMVRDEHVAWHAGKSELDGKKYVNNFSIGIELTGDTTQKPITEEQWDALIWLVKRLIKKHNIDPSRVVDHRYIAPDRKVDLDPENFDWEKFYKEIEAID